MKKIIISAFFVFLSFDSIIYCVEGEARVVEKLTEYKEPTSQEEAKAVWEKAEQESKLAEREHQESFKEWQAALSEMNKAGKGTAEYLSAEKKHGAELQRWEDAGKSLEAWQARKKELSKNELVQQYQQGLQAAYMPPEQPTYEEPGFWTTITNRVTAWFKERQADFYKWTGNQEKVIEVLQDLSQIYADLGKGGALDKARNTKKLSGAFDELSGKIGKGLESLTEYKEALDKGALTEKQKIGLQAEIQELAKELIKLREQLKTEGVDKQIRDQINAEIYKALEAFGIDAKQQKTLEDELGVTQWFENKKEAPVRMEINRLSQKVNEQLSSNVAWQKAIKADPKNYAKNSDFETFVENLDLLSRADLTQLPSNVRISIRGRISQGYNRLNDALWAHGVDMSIPAADRAPTLVRIAKLSPRVTEAAEAHNTEMEALWAEMDARDATKEELTDEKDLVQAPLEKGKADEFVKSIRAHNDMLVNNILQSIVEKDAASLQNAYDNFSVDMKAWKDITERSAVSQESIDLREKMIGEYSRLFGEIFKLKSDMPEIGIYAFDILKNIKEINAGMQLDREMMIVIKEEIDKMRADPINAHARVSEDKANEKRSATDPKVLSEIDRLAQVTDPSKEEEQQKILLQEAIKRELNVTKIDDVPPPPTAWTSGLIGD